MLATPHTKSGLSQGKTSILGPVDHAQRAINNPAPKPWPVTLRSINHFILVVHILMHLLIQVVHMNVVIYPVIRKPLVINLNVSSETAVLLCDPKICH